MSIGSVKIIDRNSAIEAIKRLDKDDLLFLNQLIVERLKLIAQMRSSEQMVRYTKGDRVTFVNSEGKKQTGTEMWLHKNTISVITDDGYKWNVSPGLLELIKY
jgi:hypothetical protein